MYTILAIHEGCPLENLSTIQKIRYIDDNKLPSHVFQET